MTTISGPFNIGGDDAISMETIDTEIDQWDIQNHSKAILYWVLVLVLLGIIYHCICCCAKCAWKCYIKKIGLNSEQQCRLEGYAQLLIRAVYVAFLMSWAWLGVKNILGYSTAKHILGGFAIGIGWGLRQYFSSVIVYFTLQFTAPFQCGKYLSIYVDGKQQSGMVTSMDFLHTKLECRHAHESIKPAAAACQECNCGAIFIVNSVFVTNTIRVFESHADFSKWVEKSARAAETSHDAPSGGPKESQSLQDWAEHVQVVTNPGALTRRKKDAGIYERSLQF